MAFKKINKGKLYMIEGGDYSGKSTLIENLKKKYPEFIYTREPGSLLSTINAVKCEAIRERLLTEDLTTREQAELFAKSRALHTKDIIDLIKQGKTVITDRHIVSSIGYQGYAGGLPNILTINKETIDMFNKNNIEIRIIMLKINEETYNERKAFRMQKTNLDVIEQKDEEFFNKVREFFNEKHYKILLPFMNECKNTYLYGIDANGTKEEVFEDVSKIIDKTKFIEIK